MRCDRFDTTLLLMAVVILAALAGEQVLLGKEVQQEVRSRSLERQLSEQARTALTEKVYAPVVSLKEAGRYQEAMLKLEELERSYPGEAHGQILKGEILYAMGAMAEAAAAFATGVRLNGDYIDRHHPLSRRDIIARLVDTSAPIDIARLRLSTPPPGVIVTVNHFNYLRSRLAGGCE